MFTCLVWIAAFKTLTNIGVFAKAWKSFIVLAGSNTHLKMLLKLNNKAPD